MVVSAIFPRPGNALLGTWALSSAQALRRAGAQVRVVAPVSWVPKIAGSMAGGTAWAWSRVPAFHVFPPTAPDACDDVQVAYPRWMLYQTGRLKSQAYRRPAPQIALGWRTLRRSILREARDFRPDAIVAQLSLVNGEIARRLSREIGVPFAAIDQDFEEIEDAMRLPARRDALTRIWREASAHVVIAGRMGRAARQVWPGDEPVLIHNGSQPAPPGWTPPPKPAELGGKIVVLSVGAFFARKQRPLLIRAFARAVVGRHPEATLRIVGAGDEPTYREAADIAASMGVADQVEVLGPLPPERVREEMAFADLFALPSRDEPFGVVYAEAMAMGLPILCCDDGGMAEIVTDGEHGRVVPPGDEAAVAAALDEMIGDADGRRRMGAAAKALFESSLTWDHHGRRLLAVLRDAAANRATSS